MALVLAIALGASVLTSCELFGLDGGIETPPYVNITNGDELTVPIGGTLILEAVDIEDKPVLASWSASNDCVTVSINGVVTAVRTGKSVVTATYGDAIDKVLITVTENRSLSLKVDNVYLTKGDVATLTTTVIPNGAIGEIAYEVEGDDHYDGFISLDGNKITALRTGGTLTITAYIKGTDVKSNPVIVHTVDKLPDAPTSVTIAISESELSIGESAMLAFTTDPIDSAQNIEYEITAGADVISISGNTVTALKSGAATIIASIGGTVSNSITVRVDSTVIDPYENVNKDTFYAGYTPAKSYTDATLRTQHGLMSGSITVPDQAPTVSEYQPTSSGKFVLNTDMIYLDGGKTYVVVDAYGDEAVRIYYGGAYITLEEVAAYLYAFGEIPPNYSSKKSPNNAMWATWGEYLRANHSNFSGSTTNYPYEPELPNISGCGGKLQYKEIDIGTTGTTSGNYTVKIYNDGSKITRGAARIVYGRYDLNGNGTYDEGEIYLFYTYNHYNDFQEYLNYYGGWGEMFGNITGGGSLSSKTDYNPTPYVPVARASFSARTTATVGEYAIITFLGYYSQKETNS